jgi:hypothetical protein
MPTKAYSVSMPPGAESDVNWRVGRVRQLFREQHPSAGRNGGDVYVFSKWLLGNEPDLLPGGRGTFYRDLKASLHGLWKD